MMASGSHTEPLTRLQVALLRKLASGERRVIGTEIRLALSLERRGLASVVVTGIARVASITPAGREIVQQQGDRVARVHRCPGCGVAVDEAGLCEGCADDGLTVLGAYGAKEDN